MKNWKSNLIRVAAILVTLFSLQTVFAQAPPCSNKWFEVRPGSVIAGPLVQPGQHKIWIGRKDPQKGTISNWKSFVPFQVNAGTKYLAMLQANWTFAGLLANDVAIRSFPNPAANVGAIYYQNKSSDAWHAFCTQNIDAPPPAACDNLIGVWEGLSGDSQFREVIYITKASAGVAVRGDWFDKRTGARKGAFTSASYRCQNGHLFFHQSYTPKPDPRWAPDNDLELWTDGNTLFIKHRYGSSSIKRRT